MLACSKEGHERERASSPLSGSALVLPLHFPGCSSLAPVSLGAPPSSPPPSQMQAKERSATLDTQKSSFLHPLELGVLTGTCQPPHPNPLPQHLWSCSPGNTDASSLSGHQSVASDTGVCVPSESVNGLGNPKSLDTGPKALRTRPSFRSTMVPWSPVWMCPSFRSTVVPAVISVAVPLHLQNSLPKVLRAATWTPPATECRGHRPAPQAPTGTLSADPTRAGTARPPRLLQPALHSSSSKEVPLFETLPQKKGHYC